MANPKYDGELISNAFMKAIGGKYYNNFVKAGFNSAKEYTWNEINDMLVKAGAGTMDCFKMSNTLEDMAKLPQWQDFIYESKKAKMKTFRQYLKEDAASRVKAAQEFEAKTGISPEDFEAYEDVRQSGVTNMFDVRAVMELSGLSKDMVMKIMKNYSDAKKVYGE